MNAALADRKVEIVVPDEVCAWLVRTTCTDRSYGARPLRRAIQRHIEDPLSEALIRGTVQLGARSRSSWTAIGPGFRSALQDGDLVGLALGTRVARSMRRAGQPPGNAAPFRSGSNAAAPD